MNQDQENKTYDFEQLSKDAQENAIEKNRDINIDDDGWEDPTIEGFKEDMSEYGISDIEVQYSGFWSQGDGASFTGEISNTKEFLAKALGLESNEFVDMEDGKYKSGDDGLDSLIGDLAELGLDSRDKIKPEDFYISIERISSRYSHENTVKISIDIDEPENWDGDFSKKAWQYLEEIEEKATEWLRSECNKLYRSLEKDYDYLTSDEAVRETLIENGYEFDEGGNIV